MRDYQFESNRTHGMKSALRARLRASCLATMTFGLPTLGILPVSAKESPRPNLNDLRPCPSVYSIPTDMAEDARRNRERYGRGTYDPHLGTDVLEALVLGYPFYQSWGVTVFLTEDSRATVRLREETAVASSTLGSEKPARSLITRQMQIPADLALRMNKVWRVYLSEAHEPISSLPPPGTMPGGCLDGSSYVFLYRGVCATANLCDTRQDSVSQRLVSMVDALRNVARSSNEGRDVALEALLARVAALEEVDVGNSRPGE